MKYCKKCGVGAAHSDSAKRCAICGGTEFVQHVYRSAKPENIPKCPICGSTNLKKLTALDRGTSAFMWGLGSNKIGKTYECRNCKATF